MAATIEADVSLQQRAEELLTGTEGDRSVLQRLRADYVARLHHLSDDFDATRELRVVERALAMVPPAHDASSWQDEV